MKFGIRTVKIYRIPQNKQVVEKALIEAQYTYPEIRCIPQMYYRADKIYSHPLNYVLTKEDSIYMTQEIKDYYRNAVNAKIFIFSPKDKDLNYSIRVLNAETNNCVIGIIYIGYKWESIGFKNLSKTKQDSLLQIFERDILPKIQNNINTLKNIK